MKGITGYLGVSRDTVLIWIEKKRNDFSKNRQTFKISEVDSWMKSGVAD